MFVFGKISDEHIVEQIKSGDEKILLHLYKEYHSLIKSFIIKNGGDDNNIDDIVQETIISLWKNVQKPTFLLQAKLSTYVIAIAKNKWFKEFKKRSRFRRVDATHSRTMKQLSVAYIPLIIMGTATVLLGMTIAFQVSTCANLQTEQPVPTYCEQ